LPYERFQCADAAFPAIIFRLRADRLSALALPPLDAPSFDSATAAGFFGRSGFAVAAASPPSFRRSDLP